MELKKTCLLCAKFSGCLVPAKICRALEAFDGPKVEALYHVLPELCESLERYQEDPYVKSEVAEFGMLKKIAEAAVQGKVVAIGIISENGKGSRITSVFVQGIYDSKGEAEAFTRDLNVVRVADLNLVPSPVPVPR